MDRRLRRMRFRALLACCLLGLVSTGPARSAPDEELLGKSAGYPMGSRKDWFFDEKVRSRFVQPSRSDSAPQYTAKSDQPAAPLEPAAGHFALILPLRKTDLTIEDFLARQRVTGLLILKDGQFFWSAINTTATRRIASCRIRWPSRSSASPSAWRCRKRKSRRSMTRSPNMRRSGRQRLRGDVDPQYFADGVGCDLQGSL